MYRKTHRALANSIRLAGEECMMTELQIDTVANRIADVCEEMTPKSASFDREVFIALATKRPDQRLVHAED